MQISNLFLVAFSFIAAVSALPVQSTAGRADLARRFSADIDFIKDAAPLLHRAEMYMYDDDGVLARDYEDLVSYAVEVDAREFESDVDEDDYSALQRRVDCSICLEAGASHTDCPHGALHPAHAECLIEWQNHQFTQNLPMTCAACRAPTGPLIKDLSANPPH